MGQVKVLGRGFDTPWWRLLGYRDYEMRAREFHICRRYCGDLIPIGWCTWRVLSLYQSDMIPPMTFAGLLLAPMNNFFYSAWLRPRLHDAARLGSKHTF